ncbi:MAG: hypothetical protein P8Q55_06495, partial [Candidatus Poseidoniaceae archaeon]|nr:hypothetical protein [Candidatus Poseidoniaceae archaeon]
MDESRLEAVRERKEGDVVVFNSTSSVGGMYGCSSSSPVSLSPPVLLSSSPVSLSPPVLLSSPDYTI